MVFEKTVIDFFIDLVPKLCMQYACDNFGIK